MAKAYSDLPLSFRTNPVTGDIKPVTGENAVKNALIILLKTPVGTRPSDPLFGNRVSDYLFAQADKLTEYDINEEVADCIKKFEPRVLVTAIESNIVDNGVELTVEYYVKGFNNPQTLTTTVSRA